MVKGTTRQVVVVKGADPKLFEQAIFLIRDEALSEGGVSEDALLEEARRACKAGRPTPRSPWSRLLWAGAGAGGMGLLWLLTALL